MDIKIKKLTSLRIEVEARDKCSNVFSGTYYIIYHLKGDVRNLKVNGKPCLQVVSFDPWFGKKKDTNFIGKYKQAVNHRLLNGYKLCKD